MLKRGLHSSLLAECNEPHTTTYYVRRVLHRFRRSDLIPCGAVSSVLNVARDGGFRRRRRVEQK